MSTTSLHQQYTGLTNLDGSFTFCSALRALKDFLVSNSWTLTQSGYYSGSGNFGASDLLTTDLLMSSDIVWFVLRSPGGKELLFVRDANFSTDVTSQGCYIAYSFAAGFSTTQGCNLQPVSAQNPPRASDSIWLTPINDLYGMTNNYIEFQLPVYSSVETDVNFGPDISDTSEWYFHVIHNDDVENSFYFFSSVNNSGIVNTNGFFAMDYIQSHDSTDLDNYVFWHHGAGLTSLTNENTFCHSKYVRAWFFGQNFTGSGTDYREKFSLYMNTNQIRFLPIAPLIYCVYDVGLTNHFQFSPGGFGVNPISNAFEIFPLAYMRITVDISNLTLDVNFDITALPPVFKGISTLFQLATLNAGEFNVVNSTPSTIFLGTLGMLLLWDGSSISI